MKEALFKKILIVTAIFLVSHLAIEVDSIYAQSNKGGYIDTHVHLNVQSMQRGEQQGGDKGPGFQKGPIGRPRFLRGGGQRMPRGTQTQSGAAANYDTAANQLLAEMDKYGIEKALIMPPPQIPGQRTVCDYKDLISVSQKHHDRLFLVAGGDTLNWLIHQYKPTEVTPAVREKFEKIAEEIIRTGAKGFGEMAVLHLSFTSHHVFEEAAADHPLLLLLVDIAARNDMPIDLHMEAVPEDMDLPEGFNKISPNNPPILHANIPAFERLLAHNRKAKIVWQHIGWDNTGYMTIELLRRLLETHPNLYFALRVVEKRQYDTAGRPISNRIVDDSWKIRPEWLKFISDFPDSFMIGTDNFFGSAIYGPGGQPLPQTMKETWSIVDQLPPELVEKVGRDNAVRVYHLD